MKSINIENRKARHDYFILDTLECGIELRGHEVKSIRSGMCSIKESWCDITDNNTLVVNGMHITKYDRAFDFDIDEKRVKRLLAHKEQIAKMSKQIKEKGVTIVPLRVYFVNGKCKMEIGICKGKHTYDKRESLKQKDIKREIERSIN